MRSPILIASSMSWVTKMTVLRTSACRRRKSLCSRLRVIGSTAPNGSSMSMIGWSAAIARATPMRWRWPPENWPGKRLRIALLEADQLEQLADPVADALRGTRSLRPRSLDPALCPSLASSPRPGRRAWIAGNHSGGLEFVNATEPRGSPHGLDLGSGAGALRKNARPKPFDRRDLSDVRRRFSDERRTGSEPRASRIGRGRRGSGRPGAGGDPARRAPAAGTQTPAFVQAVSKRAVTAGLALVPTANVAAGNRLVVQAGVWSAANASATAVTDSAGNTYTELAHFKASDDTELSVWSAPITAGGATRPTVTVKASASADVGATVLEYSGLSSAAGAAAVDQIAHATATTGGAANVSAGPTPPTGAAGELAIGFYADSGFGNTLAGDPTYSVRSDVSPTGDMELLAQDQLLTGTGATPNPTTATGAATPWLSATGGLKTAAPAPPPTAPAVPAAPSASAGDGRRR